MLHRKAVYRCVLWNWHTDSTRCVRASVLACESLIAFADSEVIKCKTGGRMCKTIVHTNYLMSHKLSFRAGQMVIECLRLYTKCLHSGSVCAGIVSSKYDAVHRLSCSGHKSSSRIISCAETVILQAQIVFMTLCNVQRMSFAVHKLSFGWIRASINLCHWRMREHVRACFLRVVGAVGLSLWRLRHHA